MSDRRRSFVVCEPAALQLAHVKHLGFVLVAVLVFHALSTPMDANAGKYYSYVQAARNIHHKYDNCFWLVWEEGWKKKRKICTELTRGLSLLRNKKLGSSRTSSNRLRMVRRTVTMGWACGLWKKTMPNACSVSDEKVFWGENIEKEI